MLSDTPESSAGAAPAGAVGPDSAVSAELARNIQALTTASTATEVLKLLAGALPTALDLPQGLSVFTFLPCGDTWSAAGSNPPPSAVTALAEQAAAAGTPLYGGACWLALPLRLEDSGDASGVLAVLTLQTPQPSLAKTPPPLQAAGAALLSVGALALDRLIQQTAAQQGAQQYSLIQQMFLESPVPIATGALDGELTQANDAYLSLLGYTRADFEAGQTDWLRLNLFRQTYQGGPREKNPKTVVVGYLHDLREQRAWEAAQAHITAELSALLDQQGVNISQLAAQLQSKNVELQARMRVLEGMGQLTRNVELDTDPYDLISRAQAFALELIPDGFAVYYEPRHEPERSLWQVKSQVGDVGNPDLQQALDAGLDFGASNKLSYPWHTGKAYFQDHYDAAADGLHQVASQLKTTATLPVLVHGRPQGIFSFGLNVSRPWNLADRIQLESLVAQLGLALERLSATRLLVESSQQLERTNNELAARTRALEAFNELSRDLTLEYDPQSLIARTQSLVVSLLPGSFSTFYELHENTWQLRSHQGSFPDPGLLASLQRGLPYGQTAILDQPYHTQQPFYQDTYDPDTNPAVRRQYTQIIRTSASFPVFMSQQVRSILVVAQFQARPWSDTDRTLLETLALNLQLALERAEQTEKLQRHMAELEVSNAELERFAFIASHSLQEPLRTVTIFAERLLASVEQPSEAQTRYGGHVRDQLQRMQSQLQDLRDFMKLRHRNLEWQPINLNRKVTAAISVLQGEIERTGAQIRIAELPPVWGDSLQLKELFTQLLDNALKFVADGQQPQIDIAAQQRGDWVELTVRDQGIGIAPEHFGQIFDVFGRLHGREQFSGNGIGLSIIRRITELHGGQVWLESELNQGTTFYLTLPSTHPSHQ